MVSSSLFFIVSHAALLHVVCLCECAASAHFAPPLLSDCVCWYHLFPCLSWNLLYTCMLLKIGFYLVLDRKRNQWYRTSLVAAVVQEVEVVVRSLNPPDPLATCGSNFGREIEPHIAPDKQVGTVQCSLSHQHTNVFVNVTCVEMRFKCWVYWKSAVLMQVHLPFTTLRVVTLSHCWSDWLKLACDRCWFTGCLPNHPTSVFDRVRPFTDIFLSRCFWEINHLAHQVNNTLGKQRISEAKWKASGIWAGYHSGAFSSLRVRRFP